jgi:hypothetical protein
VKITARSAAWSEPDSRHPNRLRFDGVLTRIGVPSDEAPNGSGGKRVLLTHAATERTLPSLVGMGVDLTADMTGHDVASKVGVVDGAWIEGDAVRIKGAIWCADFPQHAARIRSDQAKLGFSFEAQEISVESLDADPLVIVACTFTGAALLQKSAAAFRGSAISMMAAKQRESLPVSDSLKIAAGAASTVNTFVPRQLIRIMASRGVTSPADVDRRDERQLAAILENRTPEDRIDLKAKIAAAGIYPRSLPIGTPVRIPGW